jgi:hypothetical protein
MISLSLHYNLLESKADTVISVNYQDGLSKYKYYD